MLAYIKGELSAVMEEGIVVENNGMGYEIFVPFSVMNELPPIGRDVKIYTYLYVREDAMKLYGFLTKDDLHIFQLLISVNGIGPKGALGILSVISPDDLRFAVLAEDVKAISKAPGIGTKTASKLILELKDKLKLEDALDSYKEKVESVTDLGNKDIRNEAIQALVALGYASSDAMKAVRQVTIDEDTAVEDVLKQSLKFISLS